jgi:hypothetical protein
MPSARAAGEASVVDFFDGLQKDAQYDALKERTRPIDREVARLLNAEVRGDVLSLGGVWDFYAPVDVRSLTVLDVSAQMLEAYAPEGATRVHGDLYTHDFGPDAFDTIVFPLIVHHLAEGDWRSCVRRIEVALDRARGWLRPGGRIHVMDYCPHRAWYPLQRALLPLTRRFLRLVGQPLVVMHTRDFYVRTFAARLHDVQARPILPPGFDWSYWFPIFMATPWLRMPMSVYPKPYLISGRR